MLFRSWARASTRISPEVAAALLNNAANNNAPFRPGLGKGGASWFVSEGNPYVGQNVQSQVQVDVMINRQGAITIDSARLEAMFAEVMNDAAFRSETEARYRSFNKISADAALSNSAAKSLSRFMGRAAESRMWDMVARTVAQSPSKTGEVILDGSRFSRDGNGRFLLTTDSGRIQVQPDAIMSAMGRASAPVDGRIAAAVEGSLQQARLEGRLGEAARVRNLWRIGGRLMIVVGAAADTIRIIEAEDKPRTITSVAGGWTGATIAGSAAGAWFAPADIAGPWAWAGHGVVVVVAGAGGYMLGSEVTETVYDITFK